MEICEKRAKCSLCEQRIATALPGEIEKKPITVLSTEMRACSACAGDYEDPDRTAWPTEEEKSEAKQSDGADEFPEEGFRQ